MIFDSKEQKAAVITLLESAPVKTTLGTFMAGPDKEMREMMDAVLNAKIIPMATVEAALEALRKFEFRE